VAANRAKSIASFVRSVSVENQIPRAAKEAFFDVSDIARNLRHPSIVGVGRDAGDVDRSGGDVEEEQDEYVTSPLIVWTSTLRKSVAVRHSQWALRNVDHPVCRPLPGAV
jgi:hypothetical protein